MSILDGDSSSSSLLNSDRVCPLRGDATATSLTAEQNDRWAVPVGLETAWRMDPGGLETRDRLPEAERGSTAAWYLLKLLPGLLCTDLKQRKLNTGVNGLFSSQIINYKKLTANFCQLKI